MFAASLFGLLLLVLLAQLLVKLGTRDDADDAN